MTATPSPITYWLRATNPLGSADSTAATVTGRVSATAIQTVGAKGYDGFAMALVVS